MRLSAFSILYYYNINTLIHYTLNKYVKFFNIQNLNNNINKILT